MVYHYVVRYDGGGYGYIETLDERNPGDIVNIFDGYYFTVLYEV